MHTDDSIKDQRSEEESLWGESPEPGEAKQVQVVRIIRSLMPSDQSMES